jgi:hypothetical protein
MSDAPVSSRRDLEDKIVARAWADEDFRQRLKTDPHTAVADETGLAVPESIQLEVLEETPAKGYLVIPVNRAEISEEELAGASGGSCTSDPFNPKYYD